MKVAIEVNPAVRSPGFSRSARVFAIALLLSFNFTPAHADQKTFQISGTPVLLDDVTADVRVIYQTPRYVRTSNAWYVDTCVSNKSARILPGPIVVLVDSFSGTT